MPLPEGLTDTQAKTLRGTLRSIDVNRYASVDGECKADSESRRITLYVAHFGNVDNHGDVIPHGAFRETIAKRGPSGNGLIKAFFDHEELIGTVRHLEEDSTGVLLDLEVFKGQEFDKYLEYARTGAARHGSVFYRIEKRSRIKRDGADAWQHDKCHMYEGSLVIWPANEMAELVGVKHLWGASAMVDALAQIYASLMQVQRLAQDNTAHVSEEERDALVAFLDLITTGASQAKGLWTPQGEVEIKADSKSQEPEAETADGQLITKARGLIDGLRYAIETL